MVSHPDLPTFMEQVNALVEIGYKTHTFMENRDVWIAFLSLSSAKYDGITNLKDVQPGEVDEYLADGWVVADSYSKFIRMVKPSA
jgi:hypothetical protein